MARLPIVPENWLDDDQQAGGGSSISPGGPRESEAFCFSGYARALDGAYFARALAEAKEQRRICRLAADPLLPVRAFFDIGGSGASADAMAIWIAQFVDREIRLLDYIEGVGQVLAYYVKELRSRGWGEALCVLPHDGVAENSVTGKKYADHVRDAGFEVQVIKNQGKGAAMMRIESARRLFPCFWYNAATTEAGREALGWYHEKKDETRMVGLGPEHDWSSHAADAFGLMCLAYEEPERARGRRTGRAGREWVDGVTSGSPQANETVQWTVSSEERRELGRAAGPSRAR